jgi:hypothetical protein
LTEISGQPIIPTTRAVRLVHTLVAAVLGALLLAVSPAADERDDQAWIGMRGVAGIAAAPCPSASALPPAVVSQRELDAARSGSFDVFGPQPTRLVPPVDWTRDPVHANRYRQNLQKLRYLEPLLRTYADAGDVDALRQASALALDWVRQNPRGGPNTAADAWSDKVVGDRVLPLSYTTRAAACEGLLDGADERLLLGALEEHGRFLADRRNYTPDNHGLFVDLGLLRLTRFFPFLDQAPQWSALARARFPKTLAGRLAGGVWLEHSSAYQFLAIRSVEDFLRVLGRDAQLEEMLARMRSAAGWFVRPDGRITQFGDSNLERAPDWAASELTAEEGAREFGTAGFAFVRATGPDGDAGYLAVTDGFHNLTHKHADELSFELYDRSRPIVTDTGLYSKDPGPQRDFVLSSQAHSVLTVDGASFPISDPAAAYGSGIEAVGAGDGWFAIEGTNKLLRPLGIDHERLFLYRPGVGLAIIDRVRSDALHDYTRYLQLAPGIDIASEGDAIRLQGRGFEGRIEDGPVGGTSEPQAVRGSRDPLAGLTSPDFREFRARWTLAYSGVALSETRALGISLTGAPFEVTSARSAHSGWHVRMRAGDAGAVTLGVHRRGGSLAIDATPAGPN